MSGIQILACKCVIKMCSVIYPWVESSFFTPWLLFSCLNIWRSLADSYPDLKRFTGIQERFDEALCVEDWYSANRAHQYICIPSIFVWCVTQATHCYCIVIHDQSCVGFLLCPCTHNVHHDWFGRHYTFACVDSDRLFAQPDSLLCKVDDKVGFGLLTKNKFEVFCLVLFLLDRAASFYPSWSLR